MRVFNDLRSLLVLMRMIFILVNRLVFGLKICMILVSVLCGLLVLGVWINSCIVDLVVVGVLVLMNRLLIEMF